MITTAVIFGLGAIVLAAMNLPMPCVISAVVCVVALVARFAP